MCFRDEAVILNDSADGQRKITVARKTNDVDGFETLAALVADTTPEVVWENPLQNYPLSDGEITVASELMSIANAVRNDTEPEYGAYNGRKDREIDVAMAKSWANDGEPVTFHLNTSGDKVSSAFSAVLLLRSGCRGCGRRQIANTGRLRCPLRRSCRRVRG